MSSLQLVPLYTFPMAIVKTNVDFRALFAKCIGAADAAKLIDNLHAARGNLCSTLLQASAANGGENVRLVDEYLPLIYGLCDAINAQKDPLPLTNEMNFEWKGSIGVREKFMGANAPLASSKDIYFEIIMCLHSKAIGLHLEAAAFLKRGIADYAKSASSNLRAAAGVCDMLAHEVIPKWTRGPDFPQRVPEATIDFSSMLSQYLLGVAQQVAIAKALNGGAVSPTLLASLSVAVVEQMRETLSKANKYMDIGFLRHVAFIRELYTAFGYYFAGKAAFADNKVGLAIGLFQKGIHTLRNAEGHSFMDTVLKGSKALDKEIPEEGSGLPATNTADSTLSQELFTLRTALQADLIALEQEASRDNRIIHFQLVEQNPPLPGPELMMKPVPVTRPPSLSPLPEFKADPKHAHAKGGFMAWLGLGGGADAATATATTTATTTAIATDGAISKQSSDIKDGTTTKSDSELAAELQKQFDDEAAQAAGSGGGAQAEAPKKKGFLTSVFGMSSKDKLGAAPTPASASASAPTLPPGAVVGIPGHPPARSGSGGQTWVTSEVPQPAHYSAHSAPGGQSNTQHFQQQQMQPGAGYPQQYPPQQQQHYAPSYPQAQAQGLPRSYSDPIESSQYQQQQMYHEQRPMYAPQGQPQGQIYPPSQQQFMAPNHQQHQPQQQMYQQPQYPLSPQGPPMQQQQHHAPYQQHHAPYQQQQQPPQRALSDEEYARSLQAQYDSESARR